MTISIDSIPYPPSTRHNGNHGSIEPWQRHTRRNPCQICGGGDDDKRGRGERCAGYISRDEQYEYCCNPDYAGNLQPNHRTTPPTYKHKLHGLCNCGKENHIGGAEARPTTPRATPEPAAEARKVYTTIPDRMPYREAYRKVATYEYCDASSTLRYIIVRYEGHDAEGQRDKALRPFHPVADGWVMARAEVSLLYRLPDLLAADPWAPVYICEGEKDAERLASAGLIATTNAFGASSWSTIGDAPEILAGRHVVILEDNDKAGRDRTPVVAASATKAASLRVMRFPDLPEGGDVSDWLDAGHTVDELHRHCATLPAWNAEPEPASASDGATVEGLRLALDKANGTIAKAHARIRDLEAQLGYVDAIITHPKLTPAKKLAYYAIPEKVRRGEAMVVYMPALAGKVGMSTQTLEKAYKELEKDGVLERKHTSTNTGKTRLSLVPKPVLPTPARVEPVNLPKHGRHAKVRCTSCGSDRVVREVHLKCLECGVVELVSSVEVNKAEAEALDANDNRLVGGIGNTPDDALDTVDYSLSAIRDAEYHCLAAELEPPTIALDTNDRCLATPPEAPDDAEGDTLDANDSRLAVPSLRIVNAPPTPLCPDCGGATWRDHYGAIRCRDGRCQHYMTPIRSAEAS